LYFEITAFRPAAFTGESVRNISPAPEAVFVTVNVVESELSECDEAPLQAERQIEEPTNDNLMRAVQG